METRRTATEKTAPSRRLTRHRPRRSHPLTPKRPQITRNRLATCASRRILPVRVRPTRAHNRRRQRHACQGRLPHVTARNHEVTLNLSTICTASMFNVQARNGITGTPAIVGGVVGVERSPLWLHWDEPARLWPLCRSAPSERFAGIRRRSPVRTRPAPVLIARPGRGREISLQVSVTCRPQESRAARSRAKAPRHESRGRVLRCDCAPVSQSRPLWH